MRVAMLTQLHHDPPPAHLMSDHAGGAGAGERVEDLVAGVRANLKHLLHQSFRFWRWEIGKAKRANLANTVLV